MLQARVSEGGAWKVPPEGSEELAACPEERVPQEVGCLMPGGL